MEKETALFIKEMGESTPNEQSGMIKALFMLKNNEIEQLKQDLIDLKKDYV